MQRADVRLIYDRFDRGALAERLVADFPSHVYFPAELELLFVSAGFEIAQQYGDYRFMPRDRTSEYVVTVARRHTIQRVARFAAGLYVTTDHPIRSMACRTTTWMEEPRNGALRVLLRKGTPDPRSLKADRQGTLNARVMSQRTLSIFQISPASDTT